MTAIDSRPALPDLTVIAARTRALLHRHRATLVWLLPVLLVSATVSFVGLSGSPQRIDDEGTYTAQAWAITHLGELAHYTFWYDHPPLGWIQIAAYTQLTGAFARYSIAVIAAREAMVIASLISAVLVWALARRLRLSRPAAAVAALVFAISPLAVQFHRTVYLDNVATPWLLAAVLLVLNRRNQLLAFSGAALAFSIAVLSKETYLLALPILIWLAVRTAHRDTRRYTLSVAGSVLVLVGGSYLLLAAVKGELVPGRGRVSLADGLMFQLSSRTGSGSLFDPDSLIRRTLGMWWDLDPVLIVAGLAAAAVSLTIWRLRPFGVLVLAATAFMFRPGGYLPVPYVIMLLPFAALLVAGVGDVAVRRLRAHGVPHRRRIAAIAVAAIGSLAVVAAVPLWTVQLRGFLLADLDEPMRDAQSWLADNVDRDQRIIVDDAMWVDLVRSGWDRDDVVWYYKVDTDPAVEKQSPNGWRDSSYIVTTDSMRTFPDTFPDVQQAIDNSVTVASFGTGTRRVDIRQIAPEGIDAEQQQAEDAERIASTAAAQIAGDPDLRIDSADADLLTGGRVDPRAVIALGSAVAAHELSVTGFPVVAGEDGRPLRQLRLATVDGAAAAADGRTSAATRQLIASLTGQYAPDDVRVDGDAVVLTWTPGTPDLR